MIDNNCKLNFSIGVGGICDCLEKLASSYHEAVQALEYRVYKGAGSISVYSMTPKLHDISYNELQLIKSKMDRLLDRISMADELAIEFVEEIFAIFKQDEWIDYSYIRRIAVQTAFAVEDLLERNHIKHLTEFNYDEKLHGLTDIASITEFIRNMVLDAVCSIRKLQEQEGRNIIQKVKQYVKENYMHNISLSNISEKLHINQSYFSWLFKEETGKNFSSYLVEIRINMAKELLKSDSLRVYEVAKEVGYNDYRIFWRVFKKVAGVSPLDYGRKAK